MHCTNRLFRQSSFMRRSLQEAGRIAQFVVRFEGITGPTKPHPIIDFSSPEAVSECKTMSDADMGGFSTVSLTHVLSKSRATRKSRLSSKTSSPSLHSYTHTPQSALQKREEPRSELQTKLRSELQSETKSAQTGSQISWLPKSSLNPNYSSTYSTSSLSSTATTEEAEEVEPPHACFAGSISTKLPSDRPEIMRTGYAGFRTLDRLPTIFGTSHIDLDSYTSLALRVKSDGRTYFVNIQTDSIVPTDIHQHRLFVSQPGLWETVVIHLDDFVRTNHGMVVEPQGEMRKDKVKSVGVSSIDRVVGPYELCVAGIWAVNEGDDLSRLGVVEDVAEDGYKQEAK